MDALRVQKATAQDADKLVAAGVGVLADLPNYSSVHYCPDHARKMLLGFIALEALGVFFVENEAAEVVGLFMGVVAPQWFTPVLEMSELMFWVREDMRGSSAGRSLLLEAEEWAKGKGAKLSIIAAGSGWETERVVKYYERKGYRRWSVCCCKEL